MGRRRTGQPKRQAAHAGYGDDRIGRTDRRWITWKASDSEVPLDQIAAGRTDEAAVTNMPQEVLTYSALIEGT